MKKILALLMLIMASTSAHAKYTANFTGVITNVLTYPGSTLILIQVTNMPKSHPKCTLFDYMAIDPAISSESRQLVMSRILTAYTTKETVNIGYDRESHSDSCTGGDRLRVHRVG
ncbi:conserved hypothetical protein [Vibrio nigripulchritudo MADA3029]|uniref:hypothetical protein n=1 Tax=Vibrio TaxID=662 RepID=UPI0003B1A9F3|nr:MULTISPECIES: hypothetical protein [Vibrio]UAB73118.1 hypothetical protein INR79_18270 [Vibrio sp. SCSIO 43132]CCN48810.1 conserved hypothetical protein [Vibrio nigripulchritudo MADA3020]CCN54070.1 conserved hypothetical protein [Vibrio nigripulchritudo MADA3021]CCN60931.1 conserved hypothetical protein [Vibrio nigripulchritudo MADA3029]